MYYLRPGGILYTITDVEDLANWHRDQLQEHPGFELLTEEELVRYGGDAFPVEE